MKTSVVATSILAALCGAVAAQDRISYMALDPFTSLGTTVVYTGRIQTNSNDSYGLEWIGPSDAPDFVARVTNNALRIEPSTEAIVYAETVTGYYTISVPEGALSAVRAYGNATLNITGDVVNKTAPFRVVSRAAGQTYLTNITGTDLELENRGGDIIVSGILQAVNYTSTSDGGLYLSQATESVDVNLRLGGEVKINATGDIQIRGSVAGDGKIYYNRGSCSVTSGNNACEQTTTDLATPGPIPLSTSNLTTAIGVQG